MCRAAASAASGQNLGAPRAAPPSTAGRPLPVPAYDAPGDFKSNFKAAARTLPVLLGEFTATEEYVGGELYAKRLVAEAEASGVDGWMPWAVGCGFSKDDDGSREPLLSLARTMRELNR